MRWPTCRRFEWRGIPFAAWLFRIAANLISDRWQRTNREQVADEPEQIESAPASNAEFEEVERRATLFRLVDTFARGAAAGGRAAICGAEKHQGSGAGDSQDRRRGEAVAVPRAERVCGRAWRVPMPKRSLNPGNERREEDRAAEPGRRSDAGPNGRQAAQRSRPEVEPLVRLAAELRNLPQRRDSRHD